MTGELALWLLEYLIGMCGALLMSCIGLYLWMSRRELTRNEEHKRELQEQQKDFLLLHIEVVNQRLMGLDSSLRKVEAKSEEADKDIKHELDKRKENEHILFQRDEKQYAAMAKERSDLMSQLSELKADLASLSGPKNKRKATV